MMEPRTVWVLVYELDYGGEEHAEEVVGVFDSAETAQASVPGAQWEQARHGNYEAKGNQEYPPARWWLSAYTINEYDRPAIASDFREEL